MKRSGENTVEKLGDKVDQNQRCWMQQGDKFQFEIRFPPSDLCSVRFFPGTHFNLLTILVHAMIQDSFYLFPPSKPAEWHSHVTVLKTKDIFRRHDRDAGNPFDGSRIDLLRSLARYFQADKK